MITGIVNSMREPEISFKVRGPSGKEQKVNATIDTGFNGWLALPATLVTSLGLPWQCVGSATLADGSQEKFDLHEATVIWDGQPRIVLAVVVDSNPIVGMNLLDGYELNVQVRFGGVVTIKPLP